MTVGELIALLCKHCVDEADFLMAYTVNEITIEDDCVTLYGSGNSHTIKIEEKTQ